MNDLNEDSPSLSCDELKKINKKLKIKLKKHQQTSVKAMIDLEHNGHIPLTLDSIVSKSVIYTRTENPFYPYYRINHQSNVNYKTNNFIIRTNFGILADKVGSGKTFDVIGLICHTLVPKNHPKIISSSYFSSIEHIETDDCISTNLIVMPHNLTSQWKKAFEYTKLKVYPVYKRAHIDKLVSASNIYDGMNEEPSSDNSIDIKEEQCIGYYDVILLSSTMMEDFYTKFPDIKWARIIIDEVTTIKKLPVSFDMKCNFVWYISATPSGLAYIRRNYIRDMVSRIDYSIFKRIIIKNNDAYITESMSLPPMNQIFIRCDTPVSLRAIMDFVPQEVRDMLNAGNIREAVTRLNCNIDTDDNIITVLTGRTEKMLHNKMQELEYYKRLIPTDARAHAEAIKRIEDSILSLNTRLASIRTRIKSFENEECQICLSELTSPAVIPCCSNIFCLPCLAMVNNKCPMCRTGFTLNQLHIIDNNKEMAKPTKQNKLLSKKNNLINIVKKKEHGKFLVFSNYDAANDNISNYLTQEGISCGKLVGNYAVINSTIEKFKNGEIKVLILNANNYGSGLNLQMATDIVIYHEMNKELETQVIGRSQRMGRTQPLNVYYLLHENESSNCDNPSLDLNIFDEDDPELKKVLDIDNTDEGNPVIDLNNNVSESDIDTDDGVKKKSRGKKKIVI